MARAANDVTIRDVAKHAGVSAKTVSRVINEEPFVRDSTRAKVLQAIEDLGFVVDLSAKRLATGQAYAIGLIYHNASWHYILEVQKAVLQAAREAGYSTVMHPCDVCTESDSQEILRTVSQRAVDGFIFTPPADNLTLLLETLQDLGIPFVRLTPSDRQKPWPYVTATDMQGAYEMTKYLLELGHRRIGYVVGPTDQKAGNDRLDGYKAALTEYGIAFDPSLIRQGNDHFRTGFAAASDLLEGDPRPTAIFCSNDEMAAGACAGVFDAGLRVPKDVSVAGFDDIPLSRQIWPPLTTVRQPIYEMATTAANLLVSLLKGQEPSDLVVEIPTELVVRKSTCAVQ
jgi:LacI family transcriptional regulator